MLKMLLIFLISTNLCFPAELVVPLNKDQSAPYSGVLFPLEKAKELEKIVLERDSLILTTSSLEKSLASSKETNDLLSNKNTILTESLFEANKSNSWVNFLWFTLGVVATSAAVYGIKKTSQ